MDKTIKCRNNQCKDKEHCVRFKSPPVKDQKYSHFESNKNGFCVYYLPVYDPF